MKKLLLILVIASFAIIANAQTFGKKYTPNNIWWANYNKFYRDLYKCNSGGTITDTLATQAYARANGAGGEASITDTVQLIDAIPQLPWVVFPQYTTTQRNALTGMPTGAYIDNITTGRLNRFDGEYWIEQ